MDESRKPRIADTRPAVIRLEPGEYWWCACGRSATQPYCDGSHKGTGLGPTRVTIEEPKTVAFCNCKHTGGPPFCDGTHSTLSGA